MNVGDGGLRAIVFGFSDGLVTNLCLILGIVFAADVDVHMVIVTGIAGLIAGASSMAIGEYLSMTVQGQGERAQLSLERDHLSKYPEHEERHLRALLHAHGMKTDTISKILDDLAEDLERQVAWHAMFELGIDPNDQGSPVKAAVASFFGFAAGAFIPLSPWLFVQSEEHSHLAFFLTLILSLGTCLILGYCLGWCLGLTPKNRALSSLRQFVCTAMATMCVIVANYGVARLF